MEKSLDEQIDSAFRYMAMQQQKTDYEQKQVENVLNCLAEFAAERTKLRKIVNEHTLKPIIGRVEKQ